MPVFEFALFVLTERHIQGVSPAPATLTEQHIQVLCVYTQFSISIHACLPAVWGLIASTQMPTDDLLSTIISGRVQDLDRILGSDPGPADRSYVTSSTATFGGFVPPLHVAVVCGQRACAAALVNAGAVVDEEDAFGWSAVGLAWLRHGASMVSAMQGAVPASTSHAQHKLLGAACPMGASAINISDLRIVLHPATGMAEVHRLPPATVPRPLRDENAWEVHVALGVLAIQPGAASPPSLVILGDRVPHLSELSNAYAEVRVQCTDGETGGGATAYIVSVPLERCVEVPSEATRAVSRWVSPAPSRLESNAAMLTRVVAGAGECLNVVSESLWTPGSGLVFSCSPLAMNVTLIVSAGSSSVGCGEDDGATPRCPAVGVAHLTAEAMAVSGSEFTPSCGPMDACSGCRLRGEAVLPVVSAGGVVCGHIALRWTFIRGCSVTVLPAAMISDTSAARRDFWLRAGQVWGHRGSGMDGAALKIPKAVTDSAADDPVARERPFRRQHIAENTLDALVLAGGVVPCIEFDVQVGLRRLRGVRQ